jgi:serine/threonine protein kinase
MNGFSISNITKLWLMLQVVQALRFISQFGVVHLDVKETNVIVMKKLICKVLDFG